MKNAKSANLTSEFIHQLYGVMKTFSAERCAAKWADLKAKWTSKAHAEFLKNLDPHTFANSAFGDVPTWGVTNNNIVESANSTFKAFRALPIDRLIYDLVAWCSTKFIEHKEFSTSTKHSQPIIPYAFKWIKAKLLESPKFALKPGTDYFIVTHESYSCRTIVKAVSSGRLLCECTCGVYKDCGLPCEHICAVAKNKGLEVFNCVNGCYWFETYAMAYATKNGVNGLFRSLEEMAVDEDLQLPILKVPKGCPKKQRYTAWFENLPIGDGITSVRTQKRKKCGLCGALGHNKKTCKNAAPS